MFEFLAYISSHFWPFVAACLLLYYGSCAVARIILAMHGRDK